MAISERELKEKIHELFTELGIQEYVVIGKMGDTALITVEMHEMNIYLGLQELERELDKFEKNRKHEK